jgi:hypothetical protein
MHVNSVAAGVSKRKSVEPEKSVEPKAKKKQTTKKLAREDLLKNFPLFANLNIPSKLSVLNINYNKFSDNNIVSVKNQNSNSTIRVPANASAKSEVVKQNLRNILTSKAVEPTKHSAFLRTGVDRKLLTSNSTDKKPSLLLRNSSQKSTLLLPNRDVQRSSAAHLLASTRNEKSKYSAANTRDRPSVIVDQSKKPFGAFRQLRSEKSLPVNIGRGSDSDLTCLVDPVLISAALHFKKKFGKFVNSFKNGLNSAK